MKKKSWLTILTALVLALGCVSIAHAEIIPPHGFGQIGLSSFVLCESLHLRQEPDASSATLQTLEYGDRPIVVEQSDGWAYCVLGDSEDAQAGWVNADYIAVDPAWYRTESSTRVYAWGDLSAPKVALLDADTTLPILNDTGDWLVVSLRGASGWIHK